MDRRGGDSPNGHFHAAYRRGLAGHRWKVGTTMGDGIADVETEAVKGAKETVKTRFEANPFEFFGYAYARDRHR